MDGLSRWRDFLQFFVDRPIRWKSFSSSFRHRTRFCTNQALICSPKKFIVGASVCFWECQPQSCLQCPPCDRLHRIHPISLYDIRRSVSVPSNLSGRGLCVFRCLLDFHFWCSYVLRFAFVYHLCHWISALCFLFFEILLRISLFGLCAEASTIDIVVNLVSSSEVLNQVMLASWQIPTLFAWLQLSTKSFSTWRKRCHSMNHDVPLNYVICNSHELVSLISPVDPRLATFAFLRNGLTGLDVLRSDCCA